MQFIPKLGILESRFLDVKPCCIPVYRATCNLTLGLFYFEINGFELESFKS